MSVKLSVQFINYCNYTVRVIIDDIQIIVIEPHKTAQIEHPQINKITVSVCTNNMKLKNKGKYTLIIDAIYNFKDSTSCTVFSITYEKIRVNSIIYYARLFLTGNVPYTCTEEFSVAHKKQIKRNFLISKFLTFLFIQPFENFPALVILSTVISVAASHFYGWKYFLLLLCILYIFIIALVGIVNILINLIFNKNKIPDKTKEFFSYFESENIKKYYSNSDRIPFMGEIEI